MTFKTLVKDILITEVSQSKKIRKYIDFSVVLQWYKDNKDKIASILKVNPNDLENEDEIVKQSDELINLVINPQSRGVSPTDHRGGFNEFEKLEKKIMHDVLHNIYNVDKKEFSKRIDNYEFTESEIIEEIECLAIEESFMKFTGIEYVKTDFINQNINNLASYLMVAILKNDPERFVQIITGEVEPYLEIYGKQYPTKGTPYEGLFNELINNLPINPTDEKGIVKNEDDLKEFLIELIRVAHYIDYGDNSGDRGQYPNEWWEGRKSIYDDYSQNVVDNIDSTNYVKYTESDILYDIENELLENLKSDYEDVEEIDEDEYYEKAEEYVNEFLYVNELDEILDDYNFHEIITFLKENNFDVEKTMENVSINDSPSNIAVFNEENGYYITGKFFVKDGKELLGDDTSYFDEAIEEVMGTDLDDDDVDFNSNFYSDMDISELFNHLERSDNSKAIIRRYFRTDDILRNNTILNQINKKTTDKVMFFKGEYNYPSLSKNLITNNSKNLVKVLDNFRGYVINNIKTIKQNYKTFDQYKINFGLLFNESEELIKKEDFGIKRYLVKLIKEASPELTYYSNDIGFIGLDTNVKNEINKLKNLKKLTKIKKSDIDTIIPKIKNYINVYNNFTDDELKELLLFYSENKNKTANYDSYIRILEDYQKLSLDVLHKSLPFLRDKKNKFSYKDENSKLKFINNTVNRYLNAKTYIIKETNRYKREKKYIIHKDFIDKYNIKIGKQVELETFDIKLKEKR